METAAGEMTQEFKKQWFQAMLRQDMAYYDIKDVSAQAPIISNNGRQYRKYVVVLFVPYVLLPCLGMDRSN